MGMFLRLMSSDAPPVRSRLSLVQRLQRLLRNHVADVFAAQRDAPPAGDAQRARRGRRPSSQLSPTPRPRRKRRDAPLNPRPDGRRSRTSPSRTSPPASPAECSTSGDDSSRSTSNLDPAPTIPEVLAVVDSARDSLLRFHR